MELMNNVEVDLDTFRRDKASLEQQLVGFYQRALQQVREKRAKGLLGAAGEVSANHPIGTTTNQAPIAGRAPQPGELRGMGPPPITPLRNPHAHTNGDSGSGHLTNGSTVPSRGHADAEGDVTMEDINVTPGQPLMQAQRMLSQRSALEKMAPGSQVDDYHNSGSTTTSGHNQSNRTSGAGAHPLAQGQGQIPHNASTWSAHTPSGFPAGYTPNTPAATAAAPGIPGAAVPGSLTQGAGIAPAPGALAGAATASAPVGMMMGHAGSQEEGMDNSNGTESRYYPNFASAGYLDNLSQSIPDTQPTGTEHTNSLPTSKGTGSGSSTQPVPRTAIANLLNKEPLEEVEEEYPPFEPREEEVAMLHEFLAKETSGFSVEQMVQCMAELTNEVIKRRRAWDKQVVIEAVRRVFNGVKTDIEEMQVVMEGSYEV